MAEPLPYRSRDATNTFGNDDGENEDEEEDIDETVSTLCSQPLLSNHRKGLQDCQGRHTVRYRR
jgi:hypothetical protein